MKEALDWSVIRYSRVHEDHRVLSQALQVLPEEDVVLSITRYIYPSLDPRHLPSDFFP